MQRMIIFGLALAFAMCGPAIFHEMPKVLNNLIEQSAPAAADSPAAGKGSAGGSAAKLAATSSPTLDVTTPVEGLPLVDLAEVFRFDLTPGWIMQRWPRVSSSLGKLELQGYRVPLVTGTRQDDLAGSLTYYFNPKQQVQQITFDGTTGDVRRLVQFVTSKYRFARRLVNDAGQFIYEVPEPRGPAKSILNIRPAAILSVHQPWQRFDVALVMERPEEP